MGKYKINGISTKKKNNLLFMLLVIFLISVILCISSFGIATWARYRSVTGGNVEAQIARWSFKVNGEEEQFATIDLADTIDFTHVTTDKIAPGTYGSFDLDIDARGSEVSLDYYININVNEKPTNLKFYTDNSYTTILPISADNKIYLDGEFLILNPPMQEIRTIYWKWDYRIESLPATSVLQGYYSSIEGLEALVNEYESATTQQKQELALKINDKIDTYEAGGNVLLEVSVKGVQINPNFSLKRVQITSEKDQTYDVGDSVNLSLEFTENVYGDNNNTAINGTTAPEVTLGFGGASAGENIAKFVSASGNKINYTYTIKSTDIGALKIAGITGSVYNGDGKEINFGTVQAPTTPEVIGGTISAQVELVLTPTSTPTGTEVTPTSAPTPTATPTPVAATAQITVGGQTVTLTPENVADYYGKVVTNYSATSLATWRLFYVDFDGKYGEEGKIYLKADQVTNSVLNITASVNSQAALNKMKQMNPDWRNNDGVANENNEKGILWLCDETKWSGYKNSEKADDVIGAPSLEMYLDSYNLYHSKNETSGYQEIQCRWSDMTSNGDSKGYQYAVGTLNSSYGYYIDSNTIKIDVNNLYIKSKQYWWLASPSAEGSNCMCSVDGYALSLDRGDYDFSTGVCPVVSLKLGFQPELAN